MKRRKEQKERQTGQQTETLTYTAKEAVTHSREGREKEMTPTGTSDYYRIFI